MKKTDKLVYETSFHGITIKTPPEILTKLFGEPNWDDNTGDDKVNLEWGLEDEDGKVITIYDWKEYRKIYNTETIEWHIGGKGKLETIKAKEKIKELINQL
jgi:hypothetical protein